MLSEQQRQQFRTEGYLLVPDALADIGPQRVRDAYEQVRAQTEAQWRETVAADTGKGVYGLGAAAHGSRNGGAVAMAGKLAKSPASFATK